MQVPLSGLPFAPTGISGSIPLTASAAETFGVFSFRTIGLKLTLTSLSAKSCWLRKSMRPEKLSAELSSKLPPMAMLVRPATLRMFSIRRSNVPWPPRSGRIRLCVSRSPSSVILMPRSPYGSSRSTTSGVSSSPLVMTLIDIGTPRACVRRPELLGQVVHHRQIEERLAAEERQLEGFGMHAIELALDPVGDLRRRLERHLVGELVVVAVIALEAVVAGEVALQRRQQGNAELGGVVLDRREVLVERASGPPARFGTRKPFSDSSASASRSSSLTGWNGPLAREPVEQVRHLRRHHELRVGERVHEEHFVPRRQRHTNIEDGRLHYCFESMISCCG